MVDVLFELDDLVLLLILVLVHHSHAADLDLGHGGGGLAPVLEVVGQPHVSAGVPRSEVCSKGMALLQLGHVLLALILILAPQLLDGGHVNGDHVLP